MISNTLNFPVGLLAQKPKREYAHVPMCDLCTQRAGVSPGF